MSDDKELYAPDPGVLSQLARCRSGAKATLHPTALGFGGTVEGREKACSWFPNGRRWSPNPDIIRDPELDLVGPWEDG